MLSPRSRARSRMQVLAPLTTPPWRLAQTAGSILAGALSTASTLAWTWGLMLRRPRATWDMKVADTPTRSASSLWVSPWARACSRMPVLSPCTRPPRR